MFNANFRYLKDLYRNNVRLTQIEIEQVLGKAMPFTLHVSIWTAIPTYLKQYMGNIELGYNQKLPENIYWLTKDIKGTTSIRKLLNKGPKPKTTVQIKWLEKLALNEEIDWQKLFLMAKTCNVNAIVQYFNYQVIQKSLLTNRKLFLFNLIDSEKCDNCDNIKQ